MAPAHQGRVKYVKQRAEGVTDNQQCGFHMQVGGVGPVRYGGVPMHPTASQWMRPPVTSGLEDAVTAVANFKLDLLTPVVMPTQQVGDGS